MLKSISRAILFFRGRQCIAFRGDEESLNSPGNPENFLSLLNLLALHDDTLKIHMESLEFEMPLMCFPRTQNDIFEVMGKHKILKHI